MKNVWCKNPPQTGTGPHQRNRFAHLKMLKKTENILSTPQPWNLTAEGFEPVN
jgi:hypothetical protein